MMWAVVRRVRKNTVSVSLSINTSVCLTAIDHSLSKYTVHWAPAHMSLLVSPLPTAP